MSSLERGDWWSGLRGSGNALAFVPARLMMCLGLIALLPIVLAQRLSFKPIDRIGRDSLFFYLWHPMIMGVIVANGASATVTLLSSIPILLIVSRAGADSRLIRRLLGIAPAQRPPVDTSIPEVAVQAA